jgi:hypothetical protein
MPRINNKVFTFATIAWGNASMTEGSPLPMELSAHQKPAARRYLRNYYFSRTLSSSLASSNQVNRQSKSNCALFATALKYRLYECSRRQVKDALPLPPTPCHAISCRLSNPLFRPHHVDNINGTAQPVLWLRHLHLGDEQCYSDAGWTCDDSGDFGAWHDVVPWLGVGW